MNTPEKPKQGCAPGIVLLSMVGGICLFINSRCQKVAEIQAEEERQAQAVKLEEARAEKIKAEEHARKFEAPVTADEVPNRVEALMKKELGERFISSSAIYDEKAKGWKITVEGKIAFENRSMIEQEMKESLSTCAPKGMAVSSFTMTYLADFTDGLGHKSVKPFIKCSTLPGIIGKIDWGDRVVDVWELSFDKIFTTDYCHPSFAYKWTSTKD